MYYQLDVPSAQREVTHDSYKVGKQTAKNKRSGGGTENFDAFRFLISGSLISINIFVVRLFLRIN